MEDLIALLLEFLLELLFELAVYFPWDGLLWWREKNSPPGSQARHPRVVAFSGMMIGSIVGCLSLVVVPRPMLGHAAARVLNLVVTPLLCAFLARALARRRTRRGQASSAELHFWFAFAFSIVFLAIRFAWTDRPMGP